MAGTAITRSTSLGAERGAEHCDWPVRRINGEAGPPRRLSAKGTIYSVDDAAQRSVLACCIQKGRAASLSLMPEKGLVGWRGVGARPSVTTLIFWDTLRQHGSIRGSSGRDMRRSLQLRNGRTAPRSPHCDEWSIRAIDTVCWRDARGAGLTYNRMPAHGKRVGFKVHRHALYNSHYPNADTLSRPT